MKTKVYKEYLIINNMKIEKIKYNEGKNEGYFVKTRKGYVQVMINQGEAVELSNITERKEVNINEVNLKLEEVAGNGSYFG